MIMDEGSGPIFDWATTLFDGQLLNRRSEHQTEPGAEEPGER